jgi:uncharacterized membrane protein
MGFYLLIGLSTYTTTAALMALLSTKYIIASWGIFLVLPSIILNHVGYVSYLVNRKYIKEHYGETNKLKSTLSFALLSFLFISNFLILLIVFKFINDSI